MDKLTTEDNTTVSKIKVLAIGDPDEDLPKEPETSKYLYQQNLQADFRKHLGYLLLGTRSPIEVVEDWNTVRRFEAKSVKEDKKPRQYSFYFTKPGKWVPGTMISGPVLHGAAVLEEVKKRLSEENWISENVIQTPLKTKESKEYYNSDMFIQKVVSDAIDTDGTRLFKYVLNLHRAYMNENKRRK
ncbi:uncharacterized protein LOC117569391 [Drosophila albomicans]|uniref:Uncharacterized protein LOC117569391 n=1 Tax=Drosophila albomicans TaxID=7291 RepID=A0A6P8WRT2_DROAB|nr:uncharacterized protein LOC117569391 [Drosophila albomicans]XP_051861126.1 uncharacterized protein LOC117569391 [Drosophila albomicans]